VRILITGAGEVGFQLASTLSESNDVTIIDEDDAACARLEEMDVTVLRGNGANSQILIEAGLKAADIVVAVTGNDEVNIITCIIANHIGVERTIARVSNPEYIDQPRKDRKQIGISLMICPELVMAEGIVRSLYFPTMIMSCPIADGKGELIEHEVLEDASLLGPLEHADLPEKTKIVAIKRNGELIIPAGDEVIQPHDHLLLTSEANALPRLRKILHEPATIHKVMIVGGGVVGFYLASWLENMDFEVKLVEIDKDRCQKLAEKLPNTLILNGDGTDISLLRTEDVGSMDVVFSVTGIDEKNLLCSLLARQLGAKTLISRVNSNDYINLFEMVGVDRAISPGLVTVEAVLQMITGSEDAIAVSKYGAEIVELEINKDAAVIGKNVAEVMPKNAIPSMILRGGQTIMPKPDTEIEEGDRLFVFALSQSLSKLRELFAA